MTKPSDITRLHAFSSQTLSKLLAKFDLTLTISEANSDIPGSFWGESEAGLIGHTLYARPDTPIHSILHESCHFICMDEKRRQNLHTNAGGTHNEENAVCYLQIVLADELPSFSSKQMMQEMDTWGYSFRLGSTQAWFEQDAEDAKTWLIQHKLMTLSRHITYQCRQ